MKRGVVVSEHVGYIDVGLRNGIANMFLPPELAGNAARDLDNHRDDPNGKWHASAGWYHFFHIEDIAQVTVALRCLLAVHLLPTTPRGNSDRPPVVLLLREDAAEPAAVLEDYWARWAFWGD